MAYDGLIRFRMAFDLIHPEIKRFPVYINRELRNLTVISVICSNTFSKGFGGKICYSRWALTSSTVTTPPLLPQLFRM